MRGLGFGGAPMLGRKDKYMFRGGYVVVAVGAWCPVDLSRGTALYSVLGPHTGSRPLLSPSALKKSILPQNIYGRRKRARDENGPVGWPLSCHLTAGELNSPSLVKWRNKGLMAVSSPTSHSAVNSERLDLLIGLVHRKQAHKT
eukprot:7040531-Pyramimonas_sp.AAC.1